MKHGVKGTKFGKGYDSNKMLMRKLVYNFFMHGKIVTTDTKVKAVKPLIDRLATKLQEQTEANKNYILRYVNHPKMVEAMYEQITPSIKGRISGFVRNIRVAQRESDNALMSRLEWVDAVVFEYGIQKKSKPEAVKPTQEPKKQAEATQEAEVVSTEKPKKKASVKKSEKTVK